MPRNHTRVFDPAQVFYTADIHLFHKSQVSRRGFHTVEDMHAAIEYNWNHTVPPGAHVFILGDVTFGKAQPTADFLAQLNGTKHLIRGNHDKRMDTVVLNMFETVQDMLEIDVLDAGAKQRVFMCHYAMRTWNRAHFGAYHLFGHSHGSLSERNPRSMDVGLDIYGQPVSHIEVAYRLSQETFTPVDHHKPNSR